MPNPLRLEGQVVIVTGAGHGLGRSHALAFAEAGAKVLVNDLGGSHTGVGKGSAAADKVVEEIKAQGGDASANYESVVDGERIVEAALDTYGRIDAIVNNAGILRDKSFHKMTKEDWDLVYDVHVRGAFRVTHAAWPHFREQQYGRVVMTSSAAGIYGNFGQANYSMAKLGLSGLASTLAIEGRKRNIQVNTIAPIAGSRMTEDILPQAMLEALKPELVSPLVLWLCSPECEETGGLFEVGGGFYAKLRWERSVGQTFRLGRAISGADIKNAFKSITSFEETTHPADVMSSMRPIGANIEAGPSRGANEFIDVDRALGFEYPEITTSYDERDAALYALSVGAATDPMNAVDLPLVYEHSGDGFKVLPSFAVVPALKVMFDFAAEGVTAPGFNFGLDRVLHGEQKTILRRPFPPKGKLTHRSKITDIFDKGKGATIITQVRTFDEDGDELCVNELTTFVRGAGGFDGERGPSETFAVPSREPDAVEEQQVPENQALLYRLTGDWNPLHADPNFAKAMGFKQPILHGLCTYGYVTRHLIKHFLDGDPRRFKSIQARFSESVFPGETLRTEMWKVDGKVAVRCRVLERDVEVLKNGMAEFYDEIPKKKARVRTPKETAPTTKAKKGPGSVAVFLGIQAHVEAHPELKEIQKSFTFRLTDPDSAWTLDLKAGAVTEGPSDNADCTLILSDENFMLMSAGKANPQKMFMDGSLVIKGDVMASQKLSFLSKIKPDAVRERVEALLAQRTSDGGTKAQPTKTRPAVAISVQEALSQKLPALSRPKAGKIKVLVTEPEHTLFIDLKDGSVTAEGSSPGATLRLSDEDLESLASGQVDLQSLYQQGKVRIEGSVALARSLTFLHGIL